MDDEAVLARCAPLFEARRQQLKKRNRRKAAPNTIAQRLAGLAKRYEALPPSDTGRRLVVIREMLRVLGFVSRNNPPPACTVDD